LFVGQKTALSVDRKGIFCWLIRKHFDYQAQIAATPFFCLSKRGVFGVESQINSAVLFRKIPHYRHNIFNFADDFGSLEK
jgi:hypothetical protein